MGGTPTRGPARARSSESESESEPRPIVKAAVTCPHCGHAFTVAPQPAGTQVNTPCPNCGGKITITF